MESAVKIISTAQELSGIFRTDDSVDNFIQHLSRADLIARGLVDKNQMYQKFSNAIIENPSDILVGRLKKGVDYCESALLHGSNLKGELYRCSFCITRAARIEDGMPFTLSDIIFIPNDLLEHSAFNRLCTILVHEMTHVLQRVRSRMIDRFITDKWGFEVVSEFEFRQLISDDLSIRTNPDTVGRVFSKCGNVWVFSYRSAFPKNLRDGKTVSVNLYDGSVSDCPFEHVYEYMAYAMYHVLTEGRDYRGFDKHGREYREMYVALCDFIQV